MDVTVRQTLFSLAVTTTTAIGTAMVLGLGAYHAIQGRVTAGELLVVLAYIAAVYKPLETISYTVGALQDNLVGLRMAFHVLDTEPVVQEAPQPVSIGRAVGAVRFEGVHFEYPGRAGTLTDISLDVQPGQVVAIVGPTGAGKTTLMNLIPRFYDPQRGRVLLDGRDVRTLSLESLRRQISMVPQEPVLFSGTIADNIRYGRLQATMDEIVEAARAANAHDFIERLADGYQTDIGERGVRLSGGERQRICVARAFLKDAPILILDEPTSSIDSKTEAIILDALDELMVGRTTFMIAHRLSTIRHADLIATLDRGRARGAGNPRRADRARRLVQADARRADAAAQEKAGAVAGVRARGGDGVSVRKKIVVLGMTSRHPVAGMVWLTMQYLIGLERLGYEAYYVEAHGATPKMFMGADDDGSVPAAAFIDAMMRRFDLGDRWALHARHSDGRYYGLSELQVKSLYQSATLLLNLHGGTTPLPEHVATGRLVYLGTDPVVREIELHQQVAETIELFEQHATLFTWGENYGQPDCGIPVSTRFRLLPTRQPVVIDLWESMHARSPRTPSPPSRDGSSCGATSR